MSNSFGDIARSGGLYRGTTHALVDQQERMDAAIHPEADRKIAAEVHLESCTHKHTEDIEDEVYALRCTLCSAYATKDKVWVLHPETDPTGRSAPTSKASETQVGGGHYKSMAIQPAEFCQRNRLNWCEANAVKYVCRHASKKGAEDIKKAIHYLNLLLEWEYPEEGE